MNRIAIVNSSSFGQIFTQHLDRLKEIGEVSFFYFPQDISGKDLAEALKDYNFIIASVSPFFTSEFFDHHPGCKIISRHGIGYNNVDIQAASKHHTYVSIVEGIVEQDAVAENAIALLMNCTRRQDAAIQAVKHDLWKTRASYLGYQVRNKTVGVIGFGNIGSRVGSILKNGFNCRVLAHDPNLTNHQIIENGAIPVSLDECISQADILSLNAYLTKDNYHMISHEAISKMKKNVIIINTARGELIDQTALLHGLETGQIFAYGSDVVEGEPIDHTHPLLSHPHVIITPHISAYTHECLELMGDKCVSDCERVANGNAPYNCVNLNQIESGENT